MKILDCTLRDGGYYNNWDFDKSQVDSYIEAINHLPIDYIEIGYRSAAKKEYFGKYFYSPIFELENIKKKTNKKLAIILDEKDVTINDVDKLLSPIVGIVAMVRIAVNPDNLKRAILLAKKVKEYGFEVGFNVMYMSKWKDNLTFIDTLKEVNGVADYFYMVDSFGGVFPEDIRQIISIVREHVSCKLGFHGHNNLELALINTLVAIENGVEIVDATILGMGRGAGNLKTELLLTVLDHRNDVDVDFSYLEKAISSIAPLHKKYEWGTNLPYMISGISSLPQKDVMDWVTTRYYSLDTIVRAMNNKKNQIADNQKFSSYKFSHKNRVLIVGGGDSVEHHKEGILRFIEQHPDLVIIHASSKNIKCFQNIQNEQFFCLVGNEGKRLEEKLSNSNIFKGICILPPFPRKMGTYVPSFAQKATFELEEINLSEQYQDAHTCIALQIAANMEANELFFVGYDGYQEAIITQKERYLMLENEYLFSVVSKLNKKLYSLTQTNYKDLKVVPLYQNL